MAGIANPRCEVCRYWSSRIAQVVNGGPLEAVCLFRRSPNAGKYMTAGGSCDAFETGDPVDAWSNGRAA